VLIVERTNPTAKTTHTYDGLGVATSLKSPNGDLTRFYPDALGQVREEEILVNAQWEKRFFDYDSWGNLIETTDLNARIVRYGHDSVGNQTSEEWVTDLDDYRAEFKYNPLGQLVSATDYNKDDTVHSRVTTQYDTLQRPFNVAQTSDVWDNDASLIYSHDLSGKPLTAHVSQDDLQSVTTSTYDPLGRVKSIHQLAGTDHEFVEYDYTDRDYTFKRYESFWADPASLIATTSVTHYEDGRLDRISHTGYGDDAWNQLYYDYTGSVGRTINTFDPPIVSQHDGHGQLVGTTEDGGDVTGYDYDANGNRGEIVAPYDRLIKDRLNRYAYDDEGNVTQHWRFDGELVFDVNPATPSVPEGDEYVSGGNHELPRGWYRLTLDSLETEDDQTFTVELYHDYFPLATPIVTRAVDLSTDPNVINVDFRIAADRPLNEIDVYFNGGTFDPNVKGNVRLTKLGSHQEYKWDHKNRLTEVRIYEPPTGGSGSAPPPGTNLESTVQYSYDAIGNRVAKTIIPASTTDDNGLPTIPLKSTYVNGNGHVLVQKDYLGSWTPGDGISWELSSSVRNMYGPGVDNLLASHQTYHYSDGTTSAGQIVWALNDYQGTPRDFVQRQSDGSFETEHLMYDVFGRPADVHTHDDDAFALSRIVAARFAGREFDYETGLSYNRARYYEPSSGRFLSRDPLGFAAGDTNQYRYVNNSPQQATDPSGQLAFVLIGGAIALGFAGAAAHDANQADLASGGDGLWYMPNGTRGDIRTVDEAAFYEAQRGFNNNLVGVGVGVSIMTAGLGSGFAFAGAETFVTMTAVGTAQHYAAGRSLSQSLSYGAADGAIAAGISMGTMGLGHGLGAGLSKALYRAGMSKSVACLTAGTVVKGGMTAYGVGHGVHALANGDAAGAANLIGLATGIVGSMKLRWCFVADTPVVRGMETVTTAYAHAAPVQANEDWSWVWLVGGVAAAVAAQRTRGRDGRRAAEMKEPDGLLRRREHEPTPIRSHTKEHDDEVHGLSVHDLGEISSRWDMNDRQDDLWSEPTTEADLYAPPDDPHGQAIGELFAAENEFSAYDAAPCNRAFDADRKHDAVMGSDRDSVAKSLDAQAEGHPRSEPNVPRGKQKARSSMNQLLRKLMWVSCLLVSGLCFWKALPSMHSSDGPVAVPTAQASHSAPRVETRLVTTPIVDIQPGMRVLADNPLDEDLQDGFESVDPATWKQVRLRMAKEDGSLLHITLLRPDIWFDATEAAVGRTVFLDLEEMGAHGDAEVLIIEPCPDIEQGEGQVVTGKFEHESAEVIDLVIEGEPEPIGTTAAHPFWSEDRQEFVPAGQLRIGETLLGLGNSTGRLVSVSPRPGEQRVYNLEVNVEHVYHVGKSGILVHNMYRGAPKGTIDIALGKRGLGLDPKQLENFANARNARHYAQW